MEFEFNFGEQQISQPQDQTLYASVSGVAQALSNEELVFMDQASGTNHLMTMDVLQAMSLTQQFRPMHEHVQVIEQNIPKLRGQRKAIETVLDFLKGKQLLQSESDWLNHLHESQSGEGPKYAGLVVRTCDRPDQLKRLLESMAHYQEQHQLSDSVLVFDDSNDQKNKDANQKVCQAQSITVKYHGDSWQKQFIDMLKQQFVGDEQEIDWLLSPQQGFTGGRVWNLALLALAGKSFSFYDDDYLIQPRVASGTDEALVNLSAYEELSVGFGLNVRDIKENSQSLDRDVFTEMVSACGQNFGAWVAQKKTNSLHGYRRQDLERLRTNSVIKSTGNGTWGSPRAESNYWLYLLKGEQRNAFWQNRETYLDNIEASHLLHYSPHFQALSLANFAPSAIDNSELTPFSMPINKNEDHFFNCLMQACYPNQVSLHFPWMMGHVQTAKRDRSSFNHIARRPNFNNFMADYVLSIQAQLNSENPFARLAGVAASIRDLATCSDQMMANRLQEYMTKTRSDLVNSLQHILDEVPDAPIYWQADVREIIQANGRAVKENRPPVLNDWDEGMDTAACVAKAKAELIKVYDALQVWPKLWSFCSSQ